MAPRGLTVVELLIGMALLALLGSIIASAIVPMMRYEEQQAIVSSLQQEALVSMQQFEFDMRRCSTVGVTLVPPGAVAGVAMNRVSDTTFQNAVFWEAQLVVYGWRTDSTTLMRRTYPPGPASVSVFFPLTQVAVCPPTVATILASTPTATDRQLCSHVQSFQVDSAGPGLFHATLDVQAPIPGTQRVATYELSRTIYLRNDP